MKEIKITLTIAEIAAIAQRSLAEKLSGVVGGVWSGLWERIEEVIAKPESVGHWKIKSAK